MIFDIFWRKHSPPSQNALNTHFFSPFSLENRRFLRGNEVFYARTVGFWEEMNFFVPESSVFERKWTFLSKNRWFLRGNELFYPRIIGFWEEMTIYSKKHPRAGDKMTIYSKIHPGAGDKMIVYSKSLLDIQFCICIFILFFLIFL